MFHVDANTVSLNIISWHTDSISIWFGNKNSSWTFPIYCCASKVNNKQLHWYIRKLGYRRRNYCWLFKPLNDTLQNYHIRFLSYLYQKSYCVFSNSCFSHNENFGIKTVPDSLLEVPKAEQNTAGDSELTIFLTSSLWKTPRLLHKPMNYQPLKWTTSVVMLI